MITTVPTNEQVARAVRSCRITGAITLPVLGTLALGVCRKCRRELVKRALTRSGQCLACREDNTPRASTLARHALARSGGGMHLALVPPLREHDARSPSSTAMHTRHLPLAPVEVGFGSELGVRLEAALRETERHVDAFFDVVPGLRRSVAEQLAAFPNGVRAPALVDLPHDDKSARARPLVDVGAVAAPPGWSPWAAFTDRDLKPENIVETPPPPAPAAVEPPPSKIRKPRAPRPPKLDARVYAALDAAGIKHGRLIEIGRGKYSLLVEEGAAR